MDASLYLPIYLIFTTLLAYYVGIKYLASPGYELQEKNNTIYFSFIICIFFTFWLGNRPTDQGHFGDTVNYANIYDNLFYVEMHIDWSQEWLWQWLEMTCHDLGMSVHGFFTIIEFGYVFTALWAVYRLMKSHVLLAMIFVWTSLMYYSFGVNGLRNGLACHIILVSLTYLVENKLWQSVFLFLIAFGIHRSVLLPYASLLTATYAIKDTKQAIYIWLAAIPISLTFGNWFQEFFANIGFDDRMSSYSFDNEEIDANQFSSTRFRWDFLLFSSAAVAMAWYVCVKREVADRTYKIIASAYCLANAFWILVIRAPFSNRFAYLSWFMMPFVIAYPLINLAVWEDQDRKTGLILIAYASFTALMQFMWGV